MWREAGFDQLCHDLKNPLMVIRGRAQLIDRAVRQASELPETDRTRILHSLAAIEEAVLGIVEMIDDTSPVPLIGGNGRKAPGGSSHAS